MNNTDRLTSQTVTMERANRFFADRERPLVPCFKSYSFLSNVSEAGINALAEKARTISYPKNGIIISEGSAGNALYIIISGKVRVYTCDDDNINKQITLRIQGSGSYFGEVSLLTGEARSASVITLDKTVCAVISKDNFLFWLDQYPSAAVYFLTSVSGKISELTKRFRQMAFKDVYKRIVLALNDMAVKEEAIAIIRELPTQQQIASLVGASREMVGKIMNELAKGGYIQKMPDKSLIINKKFPVSW